MLYMLTEPITTIGGWMLHSVCNSIPVLSVGMDSSGLESQITYIEWAGHIHSQLLIFRRTPLPLSKGVTRMTNMIKDWLHTPLWHRTGWDTCQHASQHKPNKCWPTWLQNPLADPEEYINSSNCSSSKLLSWDGRVARKNTDLDDYTHLPVNLDCIMNFLLLIHCEWAPATWNPWLHAVEIALTRYGLNSPATSSCLTLIHRVARNSAWSSNGTPRCRPFISSMGRREADERR